MERLKNFDYGVHMERIAVFLKPLDYVSKISSFWLEPSFLNLIFTYTFVVPLWLSATILHYVYLFNHYMELEYAMNCLITLVCMTSICGRLYTVIARRKLTIKLVNVMKYEFWPMNFSENKAFHDAIYKYTVWFFKFYVYSLAVLSVIFTQYQFEIGDGNRPMGIALWYPINVNKSPGYEIAVAYIFLVNMWLNFICLHFFTYFMVFFLSFWTQLRLLCEELETISKSKFSNEDKLYEELKFLIEHHLKLIEFWRDFLDLFNYNILFEFFTATFIISSLLTSVRLIQDDVITKYMYIMVIAIITATFIFYSLTGVIVETESDRIAEAAYNCIWYDLSMKNKRALHRIIHAGQQTLTLKCKIIGDVNNKSIIDIYHTAFSVSTLFLSGRQ